MYINSSVIIVAILGIIAYFYFKNKSKQQSLLIKAEYLNRKYKKEQNINERWSQQVGTLAKLISDQLNLILVKRLIENDSDRYEQLTNKKSGAMDDSLDKWIDTSKDKEIVEVREMKDLHNQILQKLDEINETHQSHLQKYLESSADGNIEQALDEILGGYIYTDAFYRKISELKCLDLKKLNSDEFIKEGSVLLDKLDDSITSLNDRYYEMFPSG